MCIRDRSRVTDMSSIFSFAASFNSDISKWDVSKVTNTKSMFMDATSFNHDISEWDVSEVTEMDNMFMGATSFEQELCGVAWVESKATNKPMFTRSSGSISQTVCVLTSKFELKSAIDACLKMSSEGDCSEGPHGPIGEWDVSRMTDMSHMFEKALSLIHI